MSTTKHTAKKFIQERLLSQEGIESEGFREAQVPIHISSEEGLPEAVIKARKRQFVTAVAIVSHYLVHFSCSPFKPEVYSFMTVLCQ